ncbi:hypothetical protein ADK52_37800 [Streptomyces sp. WM6372]|uniref:hypothetical protein n=1 Tax=Streptomyces sp. WM6372 TaxID=1415555 RepID=UPI0006AF0DD1|nr:hypothetical protein [Streptomyces sp. WM6372]KOU13749.1 hypothetical protein ADK52_37800 [Streptomyces sp. WM6372]
MIDRGRAVAAAAWGVVALLFVAVTVWVTLAGLVGLGFVGREDQLRISQCQRTGGGRGGSYLECTGSLIAAADHGPVRVRVADGGGTAGKVVRVARAPWGTYAVVDAGFTAWATTVLYSLLSVIATALFTWLSARSVRRITPRTRRAAPRPR